MMTPVEADPQTSRTSTARAPGRINLIGEHLDYNGGRCLPIALPLGTTATVSTGAPDQVRVISRFRTPAGAEERVWSGVAGQYADDWAGYVTGTLWALGVQTSLDILIESDVPLGAGLSSSAALECSVALAVADLLRLELTPEELVRACVRAENEYVGAPTGGMDQACALFARAGQALLIDFADGSRTPVGFDPAGADLRLLVIDTGVRHRLTDGQYADRRTECARAAAALGVRRVLEAPDGLDGLGRIEDGTLRRRARHVLTEQQRVDDFVAALATDDWQRAGDLMTASHASLRDDFAVSCAELDSAVDTALRGGALGARMTGGGFGGSAIALVPIGALAGVRAGIQDVFAGNDQDAPTFFEVEASQGAQVLPAT